MVARVCPRCKEPFTPSKYHPDQEFCSKPECRRASHAAANRKWRESQRKHDPLAESQRKRRHRGARKHRMSREFAGLRREVARLQMVLLGMLMLLGGTSGEDLPPVVLRCVDRGREELSGVAQAFLEEERNRVRDIAATDR